MNESEISKKIERLEYQVRCLSDTMNEDAHPIESLILSEDWGKEEFDKANAIFMEWDKRLTNGQPMNERRFEEDFQRELGLDYQGLKPVIISFYKNRSWMLVCEAYVDAFMGAASSEYSDIENR